MIDRDGEQRLVDETLEQLGLGVYMEMQGGRGNTMYLLAELFE